MELQASPAEAVSAQRRLPRTDGAMGGPMATAPLTVSDEPLAPPPTTSQVWIAPVAMGAPMVIAPTLAGTEMPLLAEAGVRVRVPELPWLTATAVTPVGLVVNFRLSAVKSPSSVVT